MSRRFVPLMLLVLTAAGCNRPGQASIKTVSESLKGVLVYPRSSMVSMSSGDSVGQLLLTSPDSVEAIANWFRQVLVVNNWSLESDARQSDGSIAMYAERRRQPLWISIREKSGAPGANYSVTGAIVGSADSTAKADSTARKPVPDSAQRSGSSMSSKRIHRR